MSKDVKVLFDALEAMSSKMALVPMVLPLFYKLQDILLLMHHLDSYTYKQFLP
jgi:hypothetical protein